MASHPDSFAVVPTGGFINTRHGSQKEFVLKRNGVAIFRSTEKDCKRERELRKRSPRNPLAGINGELK